MALTNTINKDLVVARLTPWLAEQVSDQVKVALDDVGLSNANGLSNETVMLTVVERRDGVDARRRLVARVQPAGEGVFPAYDIAKEANVMRVLAASGIRVPAVVWQEDDPAVLGAPFLVMEFVAGRVPPDDPPFSVQGWILELAAEQRALLCDNALAQLAALDAVDPDAAGLAFLREPRYAPGTERQLERWRGIFEWATDGRANPIIEDAFAWLAQNRPADDQRLRLSWGDARLGNMIFRDDLSVAAALDWEDAALAAPDADLGWWLAMTRHHTEGIGAPLPDGFPSAEDTVRRYEELTGRLVQDLHFHEAFAATKVSILMVRAAHMLIAAGALPPESPMAVNNPALHVLAATLGVEAPCGETISYIGNR